MVEFAAHRQQPFMEGQAAMRFNKKKFKTQKPVAADVEQTNAAKIHRQDRIFAFAIYFLLILVALSLMMIFFNVLIRMH